MSVSLSLCLALLSAPELTLAQEADERATSERPESGTANELVPTYAELLALRRDLASDEADSRESSLAALMELGSEALPVVRERLRAIAGELVPKTLAGPFQRLRTEAGGRGPASDLATGILHTLESDRSEPTVLLCELVALLRALEAQHSLLATQVIVSDLLALEPQLFRAEAVREHKRLGKLLIPAYLRHRSDARPALQQLARASLTALGGHNDERLFGQPEGDLQAAIISAAGDAYAASGTHDARERNSVRWIVALLDDSRPPVREAARRTTRVFRDAADEPLRQRSTDVMGVPPEPSWSPDRMLDQLIAHFDEERTQRTSASLLAARSALEKGELGEAELQLSLALADDPTDAQRGRIASTYQELGKRLDEADLPSRALVASRRAVRLLSSLAGAESARLDLPDARAARARALYLEAEQRLGDGVADLQALREASRLDPTHPDALPLLEELRGGRIADAHQLRRQLGFLAAGLFAAAACLVLYFRRASLRRSRSTARKEGSAPGTLPSIL